MLIGSNQIRSLSLAIVLLVAMVLSSCDQWVYVSYQVVNDTDSNVVVHYRGPDSSFIRQPDSTRLVLAGQTEQLYVRSMISNRVFDPDYNQDTLWPITFIEVRRIGGSKLNKNYRLSEYWDYKTQSSTSATKATHISPADVIP